MITTSVSKKAAAISWPVRLGAASFAIAGILFFLYPLLRPFSDEVSLQAAEAFASPFWVVSHMLAVVGFILIALGVLGLYSVLQRAAVSLLVVWALVLTWVGVGFVLPYYGAEVFGLRAIGEEAIRQQSAALISLAPAIRYGPGVVAFSIGFLLLAAGPILVAIAVWRSGVMARRSALAFALGFALYIPQFFGSQPIRVAHGLLVAIGCIWLAWGMISGQKQNIEIGE